MLQNRKVAWLITIALMVVGLYLGSFLSFLSMRSQIEDVFRAEVAPKLNEQIQLFHNMITLYRINVPDTTETEDFLRWEMELAIDNMQHEIKVFGHISAASHWMWDRAEILYQRGSDLPLNEQDARRMANLLADMDELRMILRQTEYNRIAWEFNDRIIFNTTLWEILGFYTYDLWRAETFMFRYPRFMSIFF